MIEALESWSPYFLYAILLFILLAVLVGIGIITVASLTIKRAARKKPQAPAIPERLDETPKAPKTPYIDKISALVRKLLIHWGFIPKDELSRSFITAKKLLKKYIGGPNYLYQIPWYMMMGTEKSGKTTLLENNDIELPIGRPDFEFEESNPLLGWWFFDRGIVLDVRGDLVMEAQNPKSDEGNWKYLLSLIARHRPKRPLEGIILAIPSTELIGPQALTEDQIFDRAKHLYRKLWQLQANLSMRVPVYVVVTKCDRLAGFDQMCMELPPERLQEILGWSNPYSVETAYSPSWSEKLVEAMSRSLRKLRALIFTDSRERQQRDSQFLFSHAFTSLSKNLKTYVNNMFKDSAYHESFFLRGVYFVGDSACISPEGVTSDYYREDENGEYVPAQPQITFLRDLLVEKVFRESDLAQPVMRVLLSNNRILNFGKLVVFVVSVFWLIGMFTSYGTFQDTKRNVEPLLKQIARAAEGTAELDVAGKETQLKLYLQDQSRSILELMTNVSKVKLFSVAVPPSWFSPLDRRLKEALTFAYDTVVLRDLYKGMIQRGENLTNPAKTDQFKAKGESSSIDPLKLKSFDLLRNFVDAVVNFEKNAKVYNDLEKTESTDAIAQLVLYLYNKEMPAEFYESSDYFRFTLGSTKDTNIKVTLYRDFARQKVSELFNKFLQDAFETRETLTSITDLQDLLIGLNNPAINKMDDEDLRGLLEKLKKAQVVINSDAFNWIENKQFFPGDAYNDVLTKIGGSEIMGTDIANELTNEANTQFNAYKKILGGFTSELSGPFLKKVGESLSAQTGEKFNALVKTLSDFMDKRFMAKIKKYKEIIPVPPQQVQFWDEATLQSAAGLIDDYRKFVGEELVDAPVELQKVLWSTAQNALRLKMVHYVAKAQTFREQPSGKRASAMRDMVSAQVQNLKQVTPVFSRILAVFEGVGFDESANAVKDALLEHGLDLLKFINRLVRDENLYQVSAKNFSGWRGGKGLAFKAFSVSDDEGLVAYLAAQRERTIFYAKDLAQPVIDFLSLNYFEKSPESLPLLLKWNAILKEIELYEKKAPGNDIGNLEEFVKTQMNDYTINNCAALPHTKGGGFFDTRLKKVKSLMEQRCELVAEKRFYMRYNKLAQFFNSQLAGRYPFRVGRIGGGGSEASFRMIRTFYKVFDRFTPYDLKRLEREARDSTSKAEAWDFVKAMQGVRPLLIPKAASEKGVPVEPPEYKVNFRTNREQEVGANQITQMSMKVGSKTINWRDQDKSGSLVPGQPIQVIFKWASNGQNVPRTDPAQPDLRVTGTEATFNYGGSWGLMKLLSNHGEGNPVGGGQTKVWRLRFEVPTTNVAQNVGVVGPTVIFIDFELTEKGVGPSTKIVDLSAQLPTSAKLLDPAALALAEKNVEEEIKQAELAEEEEAPEDDF